jgi:hypothetical protein
MAPGPGTGQHPDTDKHPDTDNMRGLGLGINDALTATTAIRSVGIGARPASIPTRQRK